MLYLMKCVMCMGMPAWVGTFDSLSAPFPPPLVTMTIFTGKQMDCTEENLVVFGIFSSAVSAVSYYQCPFG